jgi:2-keto-4-pentenoate hydratase/2-oxohepta-3-ene-1,7-dioic acid hydratase in catechol pathway
MAIHLVRYAVDGRVQWGVAKANRIAPLKGDYPETSALILTGEPDWREAAEMSGALPRSSVELLSPITAPARIICQGANYRQHMIESGLNPDEKNFNMFFEKSDCAINNPNGVVRRPWHVALLDYEIELALVFRKAISSPVTVTPDNLHEYVFGLVVANDVSARDVQLPQSQFFKGKSYRGFCPLGPHLAVLDKTDFGHLDHLDLVLSVNGELRQKDTTANLVFKPAETISELSTFSDIAPGDILLTGTPSGCALRAPPPLVRRMMQALLPEKKLWAAFGKAQARRPQYLQPGDVMTARISSADGVVDLGEQRVTIAPSNL